MAQINKPSNYFNTVTYVANQTDDRQITVGFQPDFTWLKDRDQAVNHDLYDAVRGATKYLSSNKTNAEGTQTDGLKSFNSTGFTLGTGWGNQTTGDDYVSWNWLASNTTASNTDGSITSTVSANTTSGFSIVSYTGNGTAGATVGHGLGSTPSVIIIKGRSGENWCSYHSTLGATKFLRLNSTNASATRTGSFNDTEPTNSVFSLGTDGETNLNTQTYIAYCFSEKKGFSKFGSYTGNGNADGTFIYTGFKPAFVVIKASSTTGDWLTADTQRLPINPMNGSLAFNLSNVESYFGGNTIDFVSNGFKLRTTNTVYNTSGVSYIYMAFAESPLVGTNNIPATAR